MDEEEITMLKQQSKTKSQLLKSETSAIDEKLFQSHNNNITTTTTTTTTKSTTTNNNKGKIVEKNDVTKDISSDHDEGDDESTEELPVLSEKDMLKKRRQLYKCGSNFVIPSDIETWNETLQGKKLSGKLIPRSDASEFKASAEINEKISLWRGDITTLEIDAIVNAAKPSLLGGGGIDGAIHKAAGNGLVQECALIGGCNVGHSRITGGYRLPAKHVIHTVGPIGQKPTLLRNCYVSVMKKVFSKDIKTVAFCCISTGIYGYPNEPAAHVALKTIREILEKDDNFKKVERVIFCIFMEVDYKIYSKLMQSLYFPM
eukprot:TRINITY_DN6140_c0_g1_i2.p1 TRINITY_DN6140_c0_g1~~TRINITY_DN6140_c0_g1_i2.p1  ORF type:complete len:345 (+),score=69.98 TRINITY_DN6140_c0_g1_i2:89-1036(+)